MNIGNVGMGGGNALRPIIQRAQQIYANMKAQPNYVKRKGDWSRAIKAAADEQPRSDNAKSNLLKQRRDVKNQILDQYGIRNEYNRARKEVADANRMIAAAQYQAGLRAKQPKFPTVSKGNIKSAVEYVDAPGVVRLTKRAARRPTIPRQPSSARGSVKRRRAE